jgi:hypothetical protein
MFSKNIFDNFFLFRAWKNFKQINKNYIKKLTTLFHVERNQSRIAVHPLSKFFGSCKKSVSLILTNCCFIFQITKFKNSNLKLFENLFENWRVLQITCRSAGRFCRWWSDFVTLKNTEKSFSRNNIKWCLNEKRLSYVLNFWSKGLVCEKIVH